MRGKTHTLEHQVGTLQLDWSVEEGLKQQSFYTI